MCDRVLWEQGAEPVEKPTRLADGQRDKLGDVASAQPDRQRFRPQPGPLAIRAGGFASPAAEEVANADRIRGRLQPAEVSAESDEVAFRSASEHALDLLGR